jgi:ribosomal protein S30
MEKVRLQTAQRQKKFVARRRARLAYLEQVEGAARVAASAVRNAAQRDALKLNETPNGSDVTVLLILADTLTPKRGDVKSQADTQKGETDDSKTAQDGIIRKLCDACNG